MKLKFDENGKLAAYSKVDYLNKESFTEVEKSESELNGLVPDSFEGNWEENRYHFKLEDGEIVFDKNYKSTSSGS